MTSDKPDSGADAKSVLNTDREIWRASPGDYYSDSIHVTMGEGIGLNCGGHVIVLPIREWFKLAKQNYVAGRVEAAASVPAQPQPHTCDMPNYTDGPCQACAEEKASDLCICGHVWEEHDNDYPYACWHGHAKDATDKPCQRQRWKLTDMPSEPFSPVQPQPTIARFSEPDVERLAKFIAQKESLHRKTLDEALYHQSKWQRIVPEAREMLEAALVAEPSSPVSPRPPLACPSCGSDDSMIHRGCSDSWHSISGVDSSQASPVSPQLTKLEIELEREADERWIAEIVACPGVIVYGQTLAEAAKKAIDLMADSSQGEAERWISVSEKLPPDNDKVDVWVNLRGSPRSSFGTNDSFRVMDAWREEGKWYHYDITAKSAKEYKAELSGDYVTHWRALAGPEPSKEGK